MGRLPTVVIPASLLCAALGLGFAPGSGMRPALSPTAASPTGIQSTGHRIVFTSERDGNPEIYLMNDSFRDALADAATTRINAVALIDFGLQVP